MKKALFVFAALFVSMISLAQGEKKVQEIGFLFSNGDSYGLTYRFGTEHSLWRINLVSLSGNQRNASGDSTSTDQMNAGFNLDFGKEFRKSLSNKFDLRYGADLMFAYSKNNRDSKYHDVSYNSYMNEQVIYSPGFNLVLGLNYKLKNMLIGAEIQPYFRYETGYSKYSSDTDPIETEDISGFSYGFSNFPVMFSVVYQF